ncbi:dihydrolipoyl dehydrogenase family protein [Streptomyces sp. NPDC001380]|uniref:dihydrolipoyl dehydrogenase family protein n=1 Tax=Streptomyces sp. NPDC001380 TaxID=3364566 RepID=UPI00369A2C2C
MASVDPERSEWDVVVLGGGAAGENAAQYATQWSGMEAVIVEDALLGGECSYWACMPSKGLLRPVEVLESARHVPGVSSLVAGARLDVPAVLARRDAIVNGLSDASQVQWALGAGIDVVRGYGRLTGERTVSVTTGTGRTRTLTARRAVVVANGSAPAVPNIVGLSEARPWTSADATTMREVPERLLVLGGGVVACEAATWMRGLGAEVTLLYRARLLSKNEPFAGRLVADGLRAAGVRLRPGCIPVRVDRADARDTGVGALHGGEVTVTLDDGTVLRADEILVATGRRPLTGDLGLSSVGLPDGGWLEVDDHQTVTAVPGEWLYAVGDACGRSLLTHMGKYQARVAGEVIAARAAGLQPPDDRTGPFSSYEGHRAVPQVVFTVPEVGSVGMTEHEAAAAGLDVETVEYDMAALAGTFVMREDYRGRAKLVVDAASDVLLGATFAGSGVSELVHSATTAVVARMTTAQLWHAVPGYPTASEVWLRLLEGLSARRHAR